MRTFRLFLSFCFLGAFALPALAQDDPIVSRIMAKLDSMDAKISKTAERVTVLEAAREADAQAANRRLAQLEAKISVWEKTKAALPTAAAPAPVDPWQSSGAWAPGISCANGQCAVVRNGTLITSVSPPGLPCANGQCAVGNNGAFATKGCESVCGSSSGGRSREREPGLLRRFFGR